MTNLQEDVAISIAAEIFLLPQLQLNQVPKQPNKSIKLSLKFETFIRSENNKLTILIIVFLTDRIGDVTCKV